MAVSAFKSTSKRSTTTPTAPSAAKDRPIDDPRRKAPIRRSRSVSAAPRSRRPSKTPPPSSSDVSSQFANKRDNPLFSCSSSSPEPESEPNNSLRGRPATTSSGSGSGSRTAAHRRGRSVSRGRFGNSASDLDVSKTKASGVKNLNTWSSKHPPNDAWDSSSSCGRARNWEDGISTGSFSEAEEATIRAFFESDSFVVDTQAGEVYETAQSDVQRAVSEIRSDLEISQERARKLRADLAVEEQRGQELSKILKEILPDPKYSGSRRSRPRRKASIERLKMSQRLADEAMNYFDECLSMSTFDGSDFSSLEDPPPSSVIGVPPVGSRRFVPNEGSSFSASHYLNSHLRHQEESDNQTQCSPSFAGSDLGITRSSSGGTVVMHANSDHDDVAEYNKSWDGSFQFSFPREPMETEAHNIRHYIKKFEKSTSNGESKCVRVKSSYNADDYDRNALAESLLLDRVTFSNRIESGSLLICNIRIF